MVQKSAFCIELLHSIACAPKPLGPSFRLVLQSCVSRRARGTANCRRRRPGTTKVTRARCSWAECRGTSQKVRGDIEVSATKPLADGLSEWKGKESLRRGL